LALTQANAGSGEQVKGCSAVPDDLTLHAVSVPDLRGYDFGVGVDNLTGDPCNQVVEPIYSPPPGVGPISRFDVRRISSSKDLQTSLGIDVEASYGCAAFGAGASARFGFLEQSTVHSATLFLTISATAQLANLSIDESTLTTAAQTVVDNPGVFKARYGDLFCRACTRGGLFVGVLRFETYDTESANTIEGELQGSYGLFSADVAVKFDKVSREQSASLYCSLYSEGGPLLRINNPTSMQELLDCANRWTDALSKNPDQYSRPYQWTLSPITIANGPLPPNAAQIQAAQDVLKFCVDERADLLDDISRMQWYVNHPDRYDWSATGVTQQVLADAVRDWQFDLHTVKQCASEAMNHPAAARMPAVYAQQAEDRTYRATLMPNPLPPANPRRQVDVVSLVGLRVSTINAVLADLRRPYDEYCAWADSYYEPGTRATKPSRAQYDFLRSGVRFDLSSIHVAAPLGTIAFWSWVYAQTPESSQVPADGSVTLTGHRWGAGGVPPEFRAMWGE
jgi:hypothetical protein